MKLELEPRLELADLDAIEQIERESYPTPWSRSMFASELAKPSSLCLGAYDDDGGLVGLSDPLALRRRVARDERRCRARPTAGVASPRALLERLFEVTKDDAQRGYTLEVRVSNDGRDQALRATGLRGSAASGAATTPTTVRTR